MTRLFTLLLALLLLAPVAHALETLSLVYSGALSVYIEPCG